MTKAEKVYKVELSDGQKWQITGSRDVYHWLGKFASILELKTCKPNNSPKFTFSRLDSEIKRESLLKKGWQAQDHYINSYWFFPDREFNNESVKFWFHPDKPDLICEIQQNTQKELDYIMMWFALFPLFQKAQATGGLPFHAGLVKRNGKGFLLAAAGGTGKSTCCQRIPPPWEALSDDEALVTHVEGKGYFAHPFPTWSNYIFERPARTCNVEQFVPLSAIFFLEQAKKDEVIPLKQGKAAIYIYNLSLQSYSKNCRNLGSLDRKRRINKLFDNACKLAKSVPSYTLKVSLTGKFWEEMEKVIV